MNDGSWKREGEPEMMVQPDSAKLFWPREKSIPCHVDHRQIAKLERGESGIYPSISWAIKSAVEEQTNLGSSRLPMSEDVATEDPSTTYNKNLELDLNVSFSHAVNTPRDEKEVFSAATASKIPDAVLSEQLCTAVKDGNVGKVHELLARGCSVHSLSVEDRFIKVAAYLNEGKDPYLLAAFLRQEKTLKLLLEHGADPSQVGPHGFTALHAAVYGEGNNYGGIGRMYPPTASVIALLLQHRPLLEQGDAMGRTALMHSVAYGRYTSTRILLEHGANVHARDKYQYTTLHCAVSGRNPAIVRLLISKGVEIDARSLAGGMKGTALHHACRDSSSPSAQIVQILLDAGADKDLLVGDFVEANTPLHLAARVGNVDVINVLLDCGASIEAQTSLGWKALHYAFHYGHPLTFGRLLDFGASVTRPRLFVDATARRFRFATAVPEKNKKDCVLLLNRALAKDMKSAYITADHAHLTALVRQAIEHGPFG